MPVYYRVMQNVVYITSRGGTHPSHKAYAEAVNADFQYVDFKLRWHDISAPAWKRYLSWIVCAWTFPNREKYKIFITGGQQFPAVLMKRFKRITNQQKIVCFHANETLYFLHSGYYSRYTSFALKLLLRQYDFHICASQMQTDLLHQLTGGSLKNVFTTFNGVKDKRLNSFSNLKPSLNGKQILLICNLYAGWRLWYKGVDLMIQAVLQVMQHTPVTFTVVGEIEEEAKAELVQMIGKDDLSKIHFAGKTSKLEDFLEQSALYLHCARGEAFGISVLEAMAAGLPSIVSEWTGAKEVVTKADSALIVPLDKNAIVEKIQWYFKLSLAEKEHLSEKCRIACKSYTESKAVESFKNIVEEIKKL